MREIRKSNRRPTCNDTMKIKEFFNAYDTNKDGVISFDELAQMLDKMGIEMSKNEVKKFFEMIDVDKSNEIEFGEFLDWYTTLMDMAEEVAQEMLQRLEKSTAFSRSELETIYDNYKRVAASCVDDGTIDQSEFKQMMISGGVSSWNSFLVDGLFRMFDADNSGTITFEEFVNILSIYHNKNNNTQDKHKLMFQLYDVDKDGKISKQDMAKILNDCMCGNNMMLEEDQILKIVEATFKRNGCGEFMDMAAYMREVKDRHLD